MSTLRISISPIEHVVPNAVVEALVESDLSTSDRELVVEIPDERYLVVTHRARVFEVVALALSDPLLAGRVADDIKVSVVGTWNT